MSARTMLIVDRDPSRATTLAAAAALRGLETAQVTSGAEALHLLDDGGIDVVVTSLELSDTSGGDLLVRLRRHGHEGVPVVIVDHGAPREFRERARDHDPDLLLDTPEDETSLVRAAIELLENPYVRSRREPPAGTFRWLVLEHDPLRRRIITEGLEAPGRERLEAVFTASPGEARELIESFQYDGIVICDGMPNVDTADFLEELDAHSLTMPVVVLTDGAAPPERTVECFRAGAAECHDRDDALRGDVLRRQLARVLARFRRRAMATMIERRKLGDALEKSQEDLVSLARTDRLTGICNRGVFDEYAIAFHEEALTADRPYAICMIDVDHFKRYNDHYGHAAGDAALRTVAQALVQTLRDTDFVARYGGEEFVAILDDVTAETMHAVSNRLRLALAEAGIEHALNPPTGRLTFSIGAAVLDIAAPLPLPDLLAAADQALYRAKECGRNCTVISGEPPEALRRPA